MVNIQAICVICYHFLCWTVLSNLDMISQMVIAVLFAVVAEETQESKIHLNQKAS